MITVKIEPDAALELIQVLRKYNDYLSQDDSTPAPRAHELRNFVNAVIGDFALGIASHVEDYSYRKDYQVHYYEPGGDAMGCYGHCLLCGWGSFMYNSERLHHAMVAHIKEHEREVRGDSVG